MTKKARTLLASCFAAVFVLLTAKRVYDLSAPPFEAKDCDFTFPSAVDQTKPTTLAVERPEHLAFEQRGGTVNDASCLNKTAVYGVVRVVSEDDAKQALRFARENHLKVTSAGARHSMGGQSFAKDGLVLDMRGLNRLELNEETKVLTVQSGATWEEVQNFLDPRGLSVKAMQSINIFSVGGTLSVNAHGLAHDPGEVAPTVKSLRVMTADGEIKTASPTQNPELFRHALGGYGLFGVILDADLEVVDNEMYDWQTAYVDYKDFPQYYRDRIKGNRELGLAFARLSVAPGDSYLAETAVHTFAKTDFDGTIPAIKPDEHTALERFVINFSKTGGFGRWLRWTLEKRLVPGAGTCLSRNQAMAGKEVCLVSRNQKMYDNMAYLENRLQDTDILQEYFVTPDKMDAFVDGLRTIVKADGANLLNVTIRIVPKDTVTALPYAKEDMFAFVLYFNQKLNDRDSEILRKTTVDLIDLATGLGGTYYLPYQLVYSPEQLRKAYPELDGFFSAKKGFDPEERFTNTFYETYAK